LPREFVETASDRGASKREKSFRRAAFFLVDVEGKRRRGRDAASREVFVGEKRNV
jgi:hypothetical protein